jgi:hypothetical protein
VSVYSCLRAMLKERRDLALENLSLRQQLAVMKRSQARLKIKQRDRLFWIWLSRTWSGWRAALIIVNRQLSSVGIVEALDSIGRDCRSVGLVVDPQCPSRFGP